MFPVQLILCLDVFFDNYVTNVLLEVKSDAFFLLHPQSMRPTRPLGHYFFISWFTDFLAGKTGWSVGKKRKRNSK